MMTILFYWKHVHQIKLYTVHILDIEVLSLYMFSMLLSQYVYNQIYFAFHVVSLIQYFQSFFE